MLGSQTSTAVSSTGSVSLTGTVGALTGSRGASSVHVDRFDLGRSSSRVALPEAGTVSPMPGRPRAHTEAFAPPVRSVSAARVRMPTSPTRAQQTELKPTWYGSATMIGRKAGHVTNQDVIAATVYEDYNILAVCDGHGAEGHRVAQASKGVLLKSLESQLTAGVEVKKALVDAFQMAERNLPLMLGREVVAFSGTTATVAAVKGSQVTFAHVGDSTGCVYRVANGNATLVCRTRDHVPNIPEERARILRAGGRVSEETFGGVSAFRVYQSGQNLPGLAMSRSLGDSVAHMCGVSSEPELKDWALGSPPASCPATPKERSPRPNATSPTDSPKPSGILSPGGRKAAGAPDGTRATSPWSGAGGSKAGASRLRPGPWQQSLAEDSPLDDGALDATAVMRSPASPAWPASPDSSVSPTPSPASTSPRSPKSVKSEASVDSDKLDEMADTTTKSMNSVDQPSFSTKQDFVVVVASDGVWEEISIDEVGRRVARHGREDVGALCDSLVQDARRKWLTTRGGVADDISIMVAWF